MIKIPLKFKKSIANELKRFIPIFQNLKAKGTSTSEDDSRIILNDVLSDVLGYDKYNELSTEQREKGGRLDYVVKLTDGPNVKKRDKYDFVIEAKAVHHELSQKYIDQVLSYCLTSNTLFFVLTNVMRWQLYKVIPAKKNTKPEAELIHEVDFSQQTNIDSLTEEFYIFSRNSYLSGDWKKVETLKKATNPDDIYTIILSPKIVKSIGKILGEIHGLKITDDIVADIIENEIGVGKKLEINKLLLKKLSAPEQKRKRPSKEGVSLAGESEEAPVKEETPPE